MKPVTKKDEHGAGISRPKTKLDSAKPSTGVGFDVFQGLSGAYGDPKYKKGKAKGRSMTLGANDSDLSSDEYDNVDDCNDQWSKYFVGLALMTIFNHR